MEQQYSSQFNCACLVLDGTERAEDVLGEARACGATYFDGEDDCYVLQFPNRPKELYTENAVLRSLHRNG